MKIKRNRLYATRLVFFLFISFHFGFQGFSQHPDNYFEAKDLQHDLFWLQRKILQYHPACIDTNRYDSVNAAFEEALYAAEKPLQELQFLRLLRKTLVSLRCGHTSAIPSSSFYRYYKSARPKPFFPLQVLRSRDDMFVRFNGSNDSSIHVGDRIVTINKEPMEDVSNSIMGFLSGDGYHNTFKSFHLSLNFPTYYLFLKGPSYAYESGMVDSLGRFSSHIFSLRSQGKSSGKVLPQKSTKILLSDSYRELSVLSSNTEIACLKVFGFGGSVSWYRKAFKLIEKKGFKTLVLDLRGNSGGNLFNANQLLSYLVKDTFSMCFKRRSGKIHFNRRSDMSFSMRFSMLAFRMLKSKPKGLLPICIKENDILINRFYFEPEKNYFYSGKLVVIMDGGTFSAASMVAAQLRKKMGTKLLGEESGGGARGCNAMIMPTVTLPKTRMRVSIPLYQIDHEMGNVPFRGLIPDYHLAPDISLKVRGLDPELEFLARNLDYLPQ